MREILPSADWTRSTHNYMFQNLKYVPQTDNYSCGLYVLATAASFATNTGRISAYGYTSGCESRITEYLHDASVCVFFSRVSEAYSLYVRNAPDGLNRNKCLRRFGDPELYTYAFSRKNGYVGRDNEQQLLERSIVSNNNSVIDNGLAINDLSRYIQYLMRHVIILQRRRTRRLNSNNVRSITAYTCQEHRNG